MLVQGNNFHRFYVRSFDYDYKIRVAYMLGQVRNFLPIKIASFKTNFISRSKAPISSVYFASEGILRNLNENNITENDAKEMHPYCLRNIELAAKLYKQINSIKSYLDSDTIEMVEKVVDNYYEIESIVRKVAFENKPIDKGDEMINRIASKFSHHLLYSLNEI